MRAREARICWIRVRLLGPWLSRRSLRGIARSWVGSERRAAKSTNCVTMLLRPRTTTGSPAQTRADASFPMDAGARSRAGETVAARAKQQSASVAAWLVLAWKAEVGLRHGGGAARPIPAAPGDAQYSLFAAFSQRPPTAACVAGCTVNVRFASALGGTFFPGSDTRPVYWRTDLTRSAP